MTPPKRKSKIPKDRPFNLIVAGVGGQGILSAARLIAQAAILEQLTVSVGETFGASRRGGTVLSHIRFSNPETYSLTSKKITLAGSLVPHHMVDILIGLEPLEALRAAKYLNPNSHILLNEHLQPPVDVIAKKVTTPSFSEIKSRLIKLSSKLWTVNAIDLACQAGEIRTANTVMIGALAGLKTTPISQRAFKKALVNQYQIKAIQTINVKAFQLGLQYIRKAH
jgi:indolepyruvate ferredoxin oxidoreductase beta subunit